MLRLLQCHTKERLNNVFGYCDSSQEIIPIRIYNLKTSYVKIKFSTWSPVKDLFMFSQCIQPKINFHNVEMKRKSKVTTHRKAGEKPTPTLSPQHSTSKHHGTLSAYKYYYSDHTQNPHRLLTYLHRFRTGYIQFNSN